MGFASWQRYCTASSSGRQPNFAALNRGRQSRWALAHISSCHYFRQTPVLISCFVAEFWLHFCNFRCNFIFIHHKLLLSWVLGKIFDKSYFLMWSLTVYSDWEVYGEYSFLHRVQLPVKDHPGTAVALYKVQVWTTHQRADCSTPRLRHHSGEVRIASRPNGWGRGQIFVIEASVGLRH